LCYQIIIIIEIVIIVMLLTKIFNINVPKLRRRTNKNNKNNKEEFNISKQDNFLDENKLIELQDKLSILFDDKTKYDGVLKKIDKEKMKNHISLSKGNKSYTINKEHVYLCMKDENNNYYDDMTLLYVLLHELAHIINTEDIGHTKNFHIIFDSLLDKAVELGIYDKKHKVPNNYCEYNKS